MKKQLGKLDYILAHYDIRLLITGHGNATSDVIEMRKRQLESLDYIQKMRNLFVRIIKLE